jgi:TerC family integral membrane protein
MSLSAGPVDWAVFAGAVFGTMLLDRLVFGKDARRISFREAAVRSAIWVGVALLFAGFIHVREGGTHALTFLVAYLVEQSLSVDNLFVFLVVFSYFGVNDKYQHRVLYWGVAGALVMRAAFILAGTTMLHAFWWTSYLFGAFLVFTGIRLALRKDEQAEPEKNIGLRLARRFLRTSDAFHGDRFVIEQDGRRLATRLLLVLIVIEFTDVLFAVDSVPAVLAISSNTFIVYTSNILAVLGLRSLYFMLAGMMSRFHYLDIGLSVILVFVGVKMLAEGMFDVPNLASLGIIAGVLAIAVVASLLRPKERGASVSDE